MHQFLPFASCPIAWYHGMQPDPCSDLSLQTLTDMDEVPTQLSLLDAEQAQLSQPFLMSKVKFLLDLLQEHFISCPEKPRTVQKAFR